MKNLLNKAMDLVLGRNLAIFDSRGLGKTEEFNREIKLDRSVIDLSHYDVVDLTSVSPDDIEQAAQAVNRSGIERILQRPPLIDYVMRVVDKNGQSLEYLVHFYGKKRHQVFADDQRIYLPLFDVIQFEEKTTSADQRHIMAISQMIAPKSQFPNGLVCRLVAMQDCITKSSTSQNEMYSLMVQVANYVFAYYIYLAECFHNRPECVVETKDGKRRQLKIEPKPVEARRETKVVRRVTDKEDEPEAGSKTDTGRTITCPYWTVSGHNRTLKSGKVIWIEPYAKGVERNNPEYNKPKTYKI